MAHAAIAYAKANMRRRMMACTTSIGPGATNLVTAAALAHVNRLPVLLLPGDVFASRAPDPVLQQVEDFQDGGVSANDCFKPVSRYFDRIMHPAQLLTALPRAIARADRCRAVRPGDAGAAAGRADDGVRLSGGILRAGDDRRSARSRRLKPSSRAPRRCCATPGARCSSPAAACCTGSPARRSRAFAETHGVPVAETQAGKGALPLGSSAAAGRDRRHRLARRQRARARSRSRPRGRHAPAGFHHRLAFDVRAGAKLVNLNVNAFDALKWRGVELVGDARARPRRAVAVARATGKPSRRGKPRRKAAASAWRGEVERITGRRDVALPYEGEVIGAVQRSARDSAARRHRRLRGRHAARRTAQALAHVGARRLPRRIRLLVHGLRDRRRPRRQDGQARARGHRHRRRRQLPDAQLRDRDLGDARQEARSSSCSTIAATAASTGCSRPAAAQPFNNLFDDCVQGPDGAPRIDFAAHAASLGALAENVKTIPELEAALARARAAARTYVICIETDPDRTTEEGGWWWEVAVPEVSERESVRARARRVRTRPGSSSGHDRSVQREDRHQPDLVEQRRSALARRRDAARGRADRRQGDRLPGLRARQQVSARIRRRWPRCWRRTASSSCPAGTRAGSRAARWTRRSPRSAPHLKLLADNGATVMVYGEVADSIQGAPQPLYKRPRFVTDVAWREYADRSTRSRGTRLRTACGSPITITWARTSQSPADVDRLMALTGDEVGLLFDSGHMTFAGGDAVAMLAQARRARLPRALQGRAAARDRAWRAIATGASSRR